MVLTYCPYFQRKELYIINEYRPGSEEVFLPQFTPFFFLVIFSKENEGVTFRFSAGSKTMCKEINSSAIGTHLEIY